MIKAEHIKKHIELHQSLDQLVADFIRHTKNLPSKTNLFEFMKWSSEQTKNPTEEK